MIIGSPGLLSYRPRQSIHRNVLNRRLEKHLDDVSKGRGKLSSQTAHLIKSLHFSTGIKLSESDPQAASAYGSYHTAFNYDQKMRFAVAMTGVQKTTQTIREAEKNAEAFERELTALLQEAEQSTSHENIEVEEQQKQTVHQEIQQAIIRYKMAASGTVEDGSLLSQNI